MEEELITFQKKRGILFEDEVFIFKLTRNKIIENCKLYDFIEASPKIC